LDADIRNINNERLIEKEEREEEQRLKTEEAEKEEEQVVTSRSNPFKRNNPDGLIVMEGSGGNIVEGIDEMQT